MPIPRWISSRRSPARTRRASGVAAGALLGFAFLVAPPGFAAVTRFPAAASAPGAVDAPFGVARETLTLDRRLPATLLAIAPESSVRVPGFPVAPGRRAEAVLTRHEIYAADARILVPTPDGRELELPRSRHVFLWGRTDDGSATDVVVEVDPDAPAGRRLRGLVRAEGAFYELAPTAQADTFELASPGLEQKAAGLAPPFSCETGDFTIPEAPGSFGATQAAQAAAETLAATAPDATGTAALAAAATATLQTATIAVDTDNEIMANKFASNTTAASNYIAALFASMNAIYERDLSLRLLQGTTYLRTTADPFTATGTNNSAKLQEFTTYWSGHYGTVPRALALLLSGRGTSGAAGVAWVDALCSKSYGYAFSQVYVSGTAVSWGDTLVTAHELGHNFGSPHSHCYSPPIDGCYNGEAANGCYSGVQTCPAPTTIRGVTTTGSLMSYCHLLGGCSSGLVFHDRSVALLAPKIAAKVGVCIQPAVVVNPAIFKDGFEGGTPAAGGWRKSP